MDTWARTWQYIKKAGTVILAISILMWASLYYPRCDDSIFVQEKIAATKIVIAEMDLNHRRLKIGLLDDAGFAAAQAALEARKAELYIGGV